MERKPSINKKALGVLGLMMIGANAGQMKWDDCDKVKDYKEANCNVYDHKTGICIKCSFRYWMRPNATCVKVSDQCKTWSETNGECLSCYGGYSVYKGDCVITTQIGSIPTPVSPCNSPKK